MCISCCRERFWYGGGTLISVGVLGEGVDLVGGGFCLDGKKGWMRFGA